VLSYRVILDVPLPLVVFVSRLLAAHRREIGTRNGTRALTCWKQAVFTLAWFRDRPDIRRLGRGFGISQATAYRYKDEAAEVLAARAPTLHEALEKAVEQGLPYLILDGTLISSDRCAGKKTSKKGKEIDKWYSGKAHRPAGNVQALAAPRRAAVGQRRAARQHPRPDRRPRARPARSPALPEGPARPRRFRL
jgi:hypothetical protein